MKGQWEYISLQNSTRLEDPVFNEMGKVGWELISVIMQVEENNIPISWHYFFKRLNR